MAGRKDRAQGTCHARSESVNSILAAILDMLEARRPVACSVRVASFRGYPVCDSVRMIAEILQQLQCLRPIFCSRCKTANNISSRLAMDGLAAGTCGPSRWKALIHSSHGLMIEINPCYGNEALDGSFPAGGDIKHPPVCSQSGPFPVSPQLALL